MKKNILLLLHLCIPLLVISQEIFSVTPTIPSNLDMAGKPTPILASVTPLSGNAGERVNVTIVGRNTNFAKVGGQVKVQFHSIYYTHLIDADSVIIINDSVVKASINIPADAISPNSKVLVYDETDGQLGLYTFRVNLKNKPSIVSLSPSKGKPGDSLLEVVVKGKNTHFIITNPYPYIDFTGNGIEEISCKNDTLLILRITIPRTTSAGVYQVLFRSNAQDDLYSTFNVETPCSAYYTTSYDSTDNAFTLALDSSATTAGKFYWNFGDGTTSTAQLPSHTFALDTLYKVCLTVKTAAGDSCSYCRKIGKDENGNPVLRKKGFSTKVIPFKPATSGVNNIAKNAESITLYPNPAIDFITVLNANSLNKNESSDLLVYSCDGRLLLKQTLAKSKTEIDISGLAKGLYFLQVRDGSYLRSAKFLKN